MMLKRLALTASSAHDASCSPTYKFAGYEFDSETGDYYAYARYYNPRLGRFMSPDPMDGNVANPQSLNRYTYVLNNPTNFIDPMGLHCGDPDSWDPSTFTLTGYPDCGGGAGNGAGSGGGAGNGGAAFGGGGGCKAFLTGGSGNCPTETPQIGPLPSTQQGTRTKPRTLTCSVGNTGASFRQWFYGLVAADHMFVDFLTGTGPRKREFGSSSVPSQLMASSAGVATAVAEYLNNGRTSGTYVFGLKSLWDAGFNPVQQYVGSYQWTVISVNGGLDLQLSNFTSVHSGSYHLVPSHKRSAFPLAGTTHQYYEIFVPCER